MNWFRRHPFWGAFGSCAGGAVLLAVAALWWIKGDYDQASASFSEAIQSKQQLEAGNPYPSAANVRQMKDNLAKYRSSLAQLKEQLSDEVLPLTPLEPNEFQSRLLQAITSATEAASQRHVKLPEKFKLGFDEYVAALPPEEDAPRLARELAQAQLLFNIILDSRVDGITMFRRVKGAAAGPTPTSTVSRVTASAGKVGKDTERGTVEFTASGAPSAIRKLINQISSNEQQFFVIRTLHVKNQKEKGPPREVNATPAPTAFPSAAGTPPAPAALNFIVGNEHIDLSARVEALDFTK